MYRLGAGVVRRGSAVAAGSPQSVIGLAVGALLLAGCSQMSALAESTATSFMAASATATDVLLANNVAILEKPVCGYAGSSITNYTCAGKTVSGEAIEVSITSAGTPQANMEIKVGSSQIYNGSYHSVQTEAAQVSR